MEWKLLPWSKTHLQLQGKSPVVRVSPSPNQEEEDDSKSLETLTFGGDKDLNMHSLILVSCALPDHLPNSPSCSTSKAVSF